MVKIHPVLFILSSFAVSASASAAADPITGWIKELSSDKYAVRETAHNALIAYLTERPGQVMSLGERLANNQKNAEPEAKERLKKIVERFSRVDKIDGPDD